jgi:transcriptional regulator with XRE-family HTH domain
MNIEIADRLAKLRKEKGYSQEQLADALGISRQAVSKWERAEASPDTDNLICLAKLYGVSLDTLLKTEQPAEEIAADKKEETAEEEKEEDSQDGKEEDEDNKLSKGEIIYAEQVLHLKKEKGSFQVLGWRNRPADDCRLLCGRWPYRLMASALDNFLPVFGLYHFGRLLHQKILGLGRLSASHHRYLPLLRLPI